MRFYQKKVWGRKSFDLGCVTPCARPNTTRSNYWLYVDGKPFAAYADQESLVEAIVSLTDKWALSQSGKRLQGYVFGKPVNVYQGEGADRARATALRLDHVPNGRVCDYQNG